MSGIREQSGACTVAYPYCSKETPYLVVRVDETGHLAAPLWFRTRGEANYYAARLAGPSVVGLATDGNRRGVS